LSSGVFQLDQIATAPRANGRRSLIESLGSLIIA